MSANSGNTGILFQERFELLVSSGQANEETVMATKRVIKMIEKQYGIQLNEKLGAFLVNHLAVTLKRLQDGETLMEMPEVIWQELRDYPDECLFAATIVAELEKSLKIPIGRDELGFIAVHLCKIKTESGLQNKK